MQARGFLVAFFISVGCISVFGEIAYRAWLYWTYAVGGEYTVVTVDYPPSDTKFYSDGNVFGAYPPNVRFSLRQYGVDGAFQQSSFVRVNNLGWISPYDFALAKPASEYRIAILGDSLTASINNNIPWTSVVQRGLRESIPDILVMNLGQPGMNTQRMSRLTLPIAQRLQADSVVVNIAFENLDFPLMPKSPPAQRDAKPRILPIGDIQVPLYCSASISTGGGCMVGSPWHVFHRRELSKAEINDVKRKAAQFALRERLLWSSKLYMFSLQGVMQAAPTATVDERIDAAVTALLAIKKSYPNLIVLINPLEWYYDVATFPKIAAAFMAKAHEAGLEVIDMREHLPQASAKERHGWWNMPYDGHWSDRGAEVYGRAVADVIRKRLFSGPTATVTQGSLQ